MSVVTLVSLMAVAVAVPPPTLPLQGVVADGAGNAVDGEFALHFALYEAAEGGEAVWEESWPPDPAADCSQAPVPPGCVAVDGGVFSVLLGTHLPLDPTVFASEGALWLGVSVEGEPELTRRPLGSSAYALAAHHAAVAGSLSCTGCVPELALAFDICDVVGSCAALTAVTPDMLPADGLDEVSGGVLTTEFVDTFASNATPVAIPDNNPSGVSDSIIVPDLGVVRDLDVTVSLTNSDTGTVHLTLTDPSGGTYTLWDGTAPGAAISATWPDEQALVAGDLSTWQGANPAGEWTLTVVDSGFVDNTTDGELLAWSIQLETLSNSKVEVDGTIIAGAMQFKPHEGAPLPCSASAAGVVYFDTAKKGLLLCNGEEWVDVDNQCDSTCPAPEDIVCGQPTKNGCGSVCDNPGTLCGGGEVCVDATCVAPSDCQMVEDLLPVAESGLFTIDPDGEGGAAPFEVYCDLDTAGGGWTMVLRLSDYDGNISFQRNGAGWSSNSYGDVSSLDLSDLSGTSDMVSPAYGTVTGDDVMVRQRLGTDYLHSVRTSDAFLAGTTLRSWLTLPIIAGGQRCSSSVVYMGNSPQHGTLTHLVLSGDESGDTEPGRIALRSSCAGDSETLQLGYYRNSHGEQEVFSQDNHWPSLHSVYVFVR